MSDDEKEPFINEVKTAEEQAEDDRVEEKMKEIEALARTIFIKEEGRFDYSKKRGTDIKQNTKVHLPKALSVEEEAMLEMLRLEWTEIYKDHVKELGKRGQKEINLTKVERAGLKKRMEAGELVVVPKDKSGRFSVMSIETYLKAGKVHTDKDVEITNDEIKDIQKEVNGHVSMNLKIFRICKSWGQEDRARETTINSSESISPLYLLFKGVKVAHLLVDQLQVETQD